MFLNVSATPFDHASVMGPARRTKRQSFVAKTATALALLTGSFRQLIVIIEIFLMRLAEYPNYSIPNPRPHRPF
jgi:hypothetical protein